MTEQARHKAFRCLERLQRFAANNLGVAQKHLYDAHRYCDREAQEVWGYEATHWLKRCGHWENRIRRLGIKRRVA